MCLAAPILVVRRLVRSRVANAGVRHGRETPGGGSSWREGAEKFPFAERGEGVRGGQFDGSRIDTRARQESRAST